jgi:hypothetical protein
LTVAKYQTLCHRSAPRMAGLPALGRLWYGGDKSLFPPRGRVYLQ